MADVNGPETQGSEGIAGEPATRAPQGLVENIVANCRPQPAIPGLLVLFLTVLIAVFTYDPAVERSVLALLIPVGIIASCGLAIAAGFCSFFPTLVWILVSWWAMKFTIAGPLPAFNRYVLMAGMGAAATMLIVQGWRVATGRFVPTVRDEPAAENRG